MSLLKDTSLRAVQGDLLHVFAPHITDAFIHEFDGGVTYILPRGDGTCVLGGTMHEGYVVVYIVSQLQLGSWIERVCLIDIYIYIYIYNYILCT